MADEGDHVAASAKNQAGPPRLSHLRVNPPQTLTMMEEDWKLWKQEWKNYVKITQLDKHPEDVHTSLLLHCHMIVQGGTFLEYTIYSNSRQVNLRQTHKLCSKSWMITGEIKETMKRFNFNKRNQAMDENVDSYVTCLRTLAKTCNFCVNSVDSNMFLRNLNVLHGELSARNVTIETILLLYARIATIN